MKGYDGYSMSMRARGAYSRGLLPASKMVSYLKSRFPHMFAGLTTKLFRDVVGCGDEWHHTSSKFNRTDFYGLDTVFDYRREIKAALFETKSTTALLRELKRAGREYVMRGGVVWGMAENSKGRDGFASAVRETLAMDANTYTAAVDAYRAELAKLVAERNNR